MSFTYDLATNTGKVRLLVGDTVAPGIWSDDEVNASLYMTSSQSIYASSMAQQSGLRIQPPVQVYSYYLAAAILLRSLAASKARLASVTQLLDVKLDPGRAASGLRDLANEYEEKENNAGHFAIFEQVLTPFAARERIWNQVIRLYGNN